MSNQNRATKLPVPNTDNVDRSVTNSLEKTKFSTTMFGGCDGNRCNESPIHNQDDVWHNTSAPKTKQSHYRPSVSTTHQVMLSLDLEDIYNDEFNKMYDETPSRLYDDASPNSSSFNLTGCMCEYNAVGETSPHSPSAFLSNYSSSFSSFSSGTMSPSSSPARSSSSDSLLIGKVDQTQPKKAPHRRHRSSVVDRKYSPYESCFILTKPFHISTPESMAVELSCKELQQQIQRQKRGRPNHKELNPNGWIIVTDTMLQQHRNKQ